MNLTKTWYINSGTFTELFDILNILLNFLPSYEHLRKKSLLDRSTTGRITLLGSSKNELFWIILLNLTSFSGFFLIFDPKCVPITGGTEALPVFHCGVGSANMKTGFTQSEDTIHCFPFTMIVIILLSVQMTSHNFIWHAMVVRKLVLILSKQTCNAIYWHSNKVHVFCGALLFQ